MIRMRRGSPPHTVRCSGGHDAAARAFIRFVPGHADIGRTRVVNMRGCLSLISIIGQRFRMVDEQIGKPRANATGESSRFPESGVRAVMRGLADLSAVSEARRRTSPSRETINRVSLPASAIIAVIAADGFIHTRCPSLLPL
jgi:hypothetical protein